MMVDHSSDLDEQWKDKYGEIENGCDEFADDSIEHLNN